MKQGQDILKWLFSIVLPKLPIFILALPFVFLMRIIRSIIWIRLIEVSERIGHGIGNIDIYLLERRAGLQLSKAVDIFYSDRPWKCNRQLIKMWKRVIPVYDFVYWIAWANKKLPGWRLHYYEPSHPALDIYGLSNDAPPVVSFTTQEENQGVVLLRAMGIPPKSSIICFHARDNAFLNGTWPQVDWAYHKYRDVDVDNYTSAINELVARGYYLIRMGRTVNKAFTWKHPQVIDYAMSPWKSDFADLYLISRCHFYMGGLSGLECVARFYRKHQVFVNAIPMRDVLAWSPKYLTIFKKLWLKKEKRLMTFKEILSSELGTAAQDDIYQRWGVEVIENTAQEIHDVVFEMDERINGTWQTNEDYEELQRRFWAMYKPDDSNRVFRSRIGSKFLLQNRELL